MGRHSRPEPPPSRRSPETPLRSEPQGRRRRSVDDDHPSGPLPQFSDYPESVSLPDDLSDLDAPTRRNPSGEDISGLTGSDATDAAESGYFGGAGYFSDFDGYADIGNSRGGGDDPDDPDDLRDSDVRVLAGLGYDLGNYDDVESMDSVGGTEDLEAPTTKTSPDDLDVPTTKTSSEPELEAPTTKTSFGRKRRRRREPELDVPEDLDAPTRKHSPGPKRRRAEPTEDELRRKRRRSEKTGRRAAATESAPALADAAAEADADAAEVAPRASRAVPPEQPSEASAELAKLRAEKRPGPWSKYAESKRATSSRTETDTKSPTEDETSRSSAQPGETGYHRAVGSSRRGIAKWPIAVAAVLALLALGGLGAVWANKALNAQAEAEANSCTEGNTTLRVTTTPTIEDDVAAAAKNWNGDKPSVYSHCVTVQVTAQAADAVLPTLQEPDGKAVPGVWITPSAEWAEKLAKTSPERVSSTAEPLKNASGTYYTYVVVGGKGVDEIQQRAAQQFRDYVRETVAQ